MIAASIRRKPATVVCELGPGVLRVRYPGANGDPDGARGSTGLDGRLAEAALQAIGEPVVLVDERPVAAAELWHAVLAPLLAGHSEVLLVHPSWCTAAGLGPAVSAAKRLVPVVRTVPRHRLLHPDATFVEIGPDVVAVGDVDGVRGTEPRWASVSAVVEGAVGRLPAAGTVHIDAPAGVAGADALAARIAGRLRAGGRPVQLSTDSDLVAAAHPAAPRAPRRIDRMAAAGVLLVATVVVLAVLAALAGPPKPKSRTTDSAGAAAGVAELVEGRVAVRIPADWTVRRVTDGPGSARVEVASPADPEAIVHITQSLTPTTDLGAAAETLRSAAAEQPAGVFVDFVADDRRAGRPAVSYREVRPDHDIQWSVLLTRRVRIAIGCQSGPERRQAVAAACEQAIASAREAG